MARQGLIETNLRKERLIKKFKNKRAKLKAVVMSKISSMEEKFAAQLKLAELPRNSAANRYRNRCSITGRPRGYYRKFKLSRNMFREMAGFGLLPGVTKGSW